MTKCTILLDDLASSDSLQHHVGGKAYSCAILRQANLPVPNGFVVMRPSSITKNALKAQLKDALSYFSEATSFAVRSSAREEDSTNHSFAGIHKTRLNVSPENLFDAIQDVQASAYSKQAQAYRKVQGLNEADENSMSILVQEMVQAKVSGVAFTMNPITYDKSEMVINASWGLGESLVSGRVEPDEYHVHKVDNNIISSQLGKKQYLMSTENGCTKMTETDQKQQSVHSLSESQIQRLCELLRIIEQKYIRPQDIEWCFDGHQFWIVQSRPITITKQHTENLIEWSRANLIEILPELVTPLTLSFLCEQINNGYREFYSNILAPEEKLGPIIKPFYGRPYFNLTQFRYMCAMTGTPEADILMMMGHGSEIKGDTQIKKRPASLLKILPALMRINWKQITIKSIMRKQLNDMNQFKKEYANFKFYQSSIQETMAFICDSAIYIQRPLQAVLLIPGALILYEKLLRKICDRKQISYDKLLQSQLWCNPLSVSTAQMYDLLKLAQIARSEEVTKNFFTETDDNDYANKLSGTHFLTEFNRFLNKFGSN